MKRFFMLVLLLLASGVQPMLAQDTTITISPALEQEMSSLEEITRAIRRLDGTPVERAFPTRAETAAYLRESIEQQLPLDEAERSHDFYVALGLLEPETDLREVYLTLLSAQVAGFYDTETKIMNVIPTKGALADNLSLTEQIIYVHEYTHALQDQFFDLDRYLSDEETTTNPDRSLAMLSLVEGDASAVMNLYTQEVVARSPLAAFQILGEGLQAGNLFLPPGTPAIISRELLFPYDGGMQFIVALHQAGGWDKVNAAFENPPTTTEQVLHPDKYLAGEDAIPVNLNDATAALGEGWTLRWDTPLGEWYLREHLRTQLSSAGARAAAAGWGGDRFQVYANEDGSALASALRLVWDTPEDEAEFETAYRRFADAQFDSAASDNCWSDSTAALCIPDMEGETLIARAPTVEQARAILAAQ